MIIGSDYLKLSFSRIVPHTLSDDVRACALEMNQLPIECKVVGIPPNGACVHSIKAAQLGISDGALLCGGARCSRAPQVIGSIAMALLGATLCPERLTNLEQEMAT